MRSQYQLKAICFWALVLAIFGSLPASAGVYTVTSTADGGPGSLRAALALATSGSDTINFNLTYPATITLTSDELHLYYNVTITGPGPSKSLTISGGGNFRVFETDSASVSISGLNITNGKAVSSSSNNYPGVGGAIYNGLGTMSLTGVTLSSNAAAEGGAIFNNGPMTITNCTISGNTATTSATLSGLGGGIFNYGALTVSGSTISNNSALQGTGTYSASGGGIFNSFIGLSSTGVLMVNNSTISGNSAQSEGGGIDNDNGTITVTNSTVSGSSAFQGAGIENDGTGTVIGSTITGNTGRGSGAGMFNNGTLTVTNSTVSGNSGNASGAIESGPSAPAVYISFSTISGNSATAFAGGITNFGLVMTVKNSILANNGGAGNCYVYTGYPAITSAGYNLSTDATCGAFFTGTGDLNSTAAGLDTGLKGNGGLTQTIALLSGSPAIDAIPVSPTNYCTDTSGNAVTTDQRGTARPQGSACDMGAFEYIEGMTPQSITFTALTNMPLGAAPFTVSASATSGLAITFNSQTPTICAVSGTNGSTVTLGAVGTCTIQATQDGNATYAAATPVSQSFSVTSSSLISQTITFTGPANQRITTASVTVSATASSGLPVSFNSQTPSVCSVAGNTVTLGIAGMCTIQATQAGNATYAAALPVSQSFQITLLPQTITFNTLPNLLLGTPPFTLSATSTSGLEVSFLSATPYTCTVSGTTATLKAGGFCTIEAMQPGSSTYAAAPNVYQTFNVEATSVSYGTFTRVNQFDSYDHADQFKGGLGISPTVDAAGSDIGENYAQAGFSPVTFKTATGSIISNSGPSVGVDSDSNQGAGSAMALAFTTFDAPPTGSFAVNAVLDGEFMSAPFALPDGQMAAAAQIFVVKTALFNALFTGKTTAQIQQMLMGIPGTAPINPNQAILNLEAVLAGMVYTNGSAYVSPSQNFVRFDTPLSYPLNTGLVNVPATDGQFTVVFAVAASTSVGGTSYAFGSGDVNFIHTLAPSPTFFTDADGNEFEGIAPAGPSAPTPPAPATITLVANTPSQLVGAAATLTATVTDTTGAPLPGAIVNFKVTSGPNAGATGGGVTGANGQALMSYIGNGGVGTDYIQATSGSLQSTVVSQAWTVVPLSSGSTCNGMFNGTFNGDLTVTNGQNCVLVGATINGNISQTGGSLTIGNSTVSGNVQVQGGSTFSSGPYTVFKRNLAIENIVAGAAPSQVCGTTVQGNLQVQGNGAAVQIGSAVSCPGNTIGGNAAVDNNIGATTVVGNTVGGNLQDDGNTAPTQVFRNTVTGSLQCVSDSSVTGGGNTAAQKVGQCAVF